MQGLDGEGDFLVDRVHVQHYRIKLIADGDLAGAINTCFPDTGVDVLMGTGNAPEGIMSAAAIRGIGGDMQARLQPRDEAERARARAMGNEDVDRVLTAADMAGGSVMFAVTGVTNGDFLKGVRFTGDGARTQSVVVRSKTGTLRYIDTVHRFSRSPEY